MSYSRVLDEQAKTLQWWRSGAGGEFVAGYFGKIAQTAKESAHQTIAQVSEMAAEWGESYYWAPTMCDVLASVAPSFPDWTLHADAVPSAHGFCWFARPLPMPPILKEGVKDDITQDIQAVSWCLVSKHEEGAFIPLPTAHPVRVDEGEQLGLTFYSALPGQRGMWPLAWWHWTVGETVSLAAESKGVPTEARLRRIQYLGAAFSLMAQRIIVSPQQRADRSTRKRLPEDWKHEPTVRVIQLRRAENAAHHERDGEPVEWSCSWVVRGHWRQQACGPEFSERRPVFVLPYVKGDPDKPLKAAADRVFAVTR
jgi:hypothetical protein